MANRAVHRNARYRTPCSAITDRIRENAAELIGTASGHFLETLTHAVQAQDALLFTRLDGRESHRCLCGCLLLTSYLDCRRVGRVVFAALAFRSRGVDAVGRDQTRIQSKDSMFAGPMMCAGTHDLHHQAPRRQLRAPCQELIGLDGSGDHSRTCRVHRVQLNHLFGQVHNDPNNSVSCNLAPGFLRSNLRSTIRMSILVHRHRHWTEEVPSYSFRATVNGSRRWTRGASDDSAPRVQGRPPPRAA